jgi:sarcosine oxidase
MTFAAMGEQREFDVAVVGLGGLGSAAAYWLARAGHDVVGFEQFELGHVRGASHDHSRIIRRSYHTPGYVSLTAAAYESWQLVERDADEQLITRTGGIDLFPPAAAIDPAPYRDSLDAVGVPYEILDAAEIRRRWPAFAHGTTIDGDVNAIYSAETGIVPPARSTAVLQRLAAAYGAELRPMTSVVNVIPSHGEADVVTDAGTVRVGRVVICADAWVNRLIAPLGHAIPVTVTREQVSYFPCRDSALQPGRFPVWIWMHDPSYYGFPIYGQLDSVKASEDCGGPEVDPDTRSFEPDAAMEQRLAEFMAGLLGDRLGAPRTTTCLYTLTADRDFVVDRIPGSEQIAVALGAAHGFKFAAWFGRTLAALAPGAAKPAELAPFALDRDSLHQPFDRAGWLV